MKLLEIYENLFQAICRLNRVAKTHSHPDYGRVRSDIEKLLEQIPRTAESNGVPSRKIQALELPMIFFVDYMISASGLKFASQWSSNRLAYKKNELAGDEKFFDFLNADLKDASEEATERLTVYYTCLGLGFAGMYMNQPERLRRYLDEIFERIRRWIDADPKSKVSPEAYNHTDKRVLTEPPNHKIIFISILVLFLGLTVLVFYYTFYAAALKDLDHSVGTIIEQERSSIKEHRAPF